MLEIEYLPNQPVQFYKYNPTTSEIEGGQTSWATTAYHKRLGNCYFIGPDYCHPVLNSEALTFQFKASTIGDNLVTAFYTPVSTGSNTTATTDKLIDAAADFVTDGVALNMLVLNTDDNLSSYVDNVDSLTTLTLADDIFIGTGNNYAILPVKVTANFRYDDAGPTFYVDTAAASSVEYQSALTINSWYMITIVITDITAGSLSIVLGTNTIATISSIGTHTVYGQCLATPDLQIVSSSTFIGSFEADTLEAIQLQTEYYIVAFDKETELFVDYLPWTETSDSLTIGNIFVNTPISTFIPTCGSYVLGITEGPICDGDIVRNGNMSSDTYWTFDTGIAIAGGKLNFTSVSAGNVALNNGSCTIALGQSYDCQFTISSNGGLMLGNFSIVIGDFVVYSHDAATMANPTTVSFSGVSLGTNNYTSIVADDTCTFSIDNFSVTVTPTALYTAMDGLSECLCICDTQDCTTLIEYSANQTTFGEFFDTTNDRMRIRIPGRLRNDTTPTIDFDPFKSTLDNQVQPYNNLNRAEELATQFMPAWVHNTLSVALSHPIVWIDGVNYICTGAHVPNWTNDSELCEGVSKVMKKNQGNLRNTY
jgi:hypothetical protein